MLLSQFGFFHYCALQDHLSSIKMIYYTINRIKEGAMKKAVVFLALVFLLGSLGWARPWAIAVNNDGANIHIIDLGQSPPRVYGPFLTGQLGHQRGLCDVAVTPDDHYALITNFWEYEVYRIDISNPTNPQLAGKLAISEIWPEDIAISPDGKFAVISDGESTVSENIIFLDPETFNSYSVYKLGTYGSSAQAVDIAPNGTIIICDINANRIIFGRVNTSYTGLVSENTLSSPEGPINVTISPDGTTALVANIDKRRLGVFQITGAGTVVTGVPAYIDLSYYPQSIDFSPTGAQAYIVSVWEHPDKISWFNVNAPGRVTVGASPAANLLSSSGFAYYGIDVLAVAPGGTQAVVGTNGIDRPFDLQLVNLNTFGVTSIPTGGEDPAGVATFWAALLSPSGLSLTPLENSYIFYKEQVNQLAWQANANTRADVVYYRIYRKSYGAADSTYLQLGEVNASTLQYNDRNVDRTKRYTYRVTAVDDLGRESQPAEVSN
jgi:DNA-binding beta-propeller fold protein YncE